MRGTRSANTASATGAPGNSTALTCPPLRFGATSDTFLPRVVAPKAGEEASMEEVPFAREDHRDAELVRPRDVLLVAHRAARLDDDGDAGLGRGFDAIGERIKRVARACPALRATSRFLRRDLTGLDAVLLAGADSPRHAVVHEDDRVRLHVAADSES